jgi:ApbE superfamily uncharacterized protein (UPF0280 family)
MKSSRYQRRFYRNWVKAKDLFLTRFIAKETDLQIMTDKPVDRRFLEARIRDYRWDIEEYIDKDRMFLVALKPLAVELNAPALVKEMAKQSRKANVGPMASVAGAVAEFLGRDLLKKGYKDVIVENGGDIFLRTRKSRVIAIYSGESKLWRNLAIKIKSKDTPLGVCTSSGTLGHSLSFGLADSAVILSKSATLADAVATAACNLVQSQHDLEKALLFTRSIEGVSAAAIIFKNNLVSWGAIEFVKNP